MSFTNKKRMLFGGFISLAFIVILASCANDSDSANGKQEVPVPDSAAAKAAADSAAAAKNATHKKKTGKASAAMSSNITGNKVQKGPDGVYSYAEKMPEYPGGEEALSKFVEDHISYPENAIDQNTEGTVMVSFVVDENGKVVNPIATSNGGGNGLDAEAIRVVKMMPSWKPGMVKGKAVKTRLSLPVTFKLS